MRKHHWGLFFFLVLMAAMLAGGVLLLADGVMHPHPVPSWVLPLIPHLG